MENGNIKNRNSNKILNDKSNLENGNDNTNINQELNNSVIFPNNNYTLNNGSYQNNRELIEIKKKTVLNFKSLDAKIKHKKLREGD